LLSAGLKHTKRLLEHGMVLGPDGKKMSKTLGNIISPFEQEKKYGAEVVRFYLLSGISTFADSAYKEEDLVNMYNSRLANNFGNLLNRVIHLANDRNVKINDENTVEESFRQEVDSFVSSVEYLYEDFEIALAVEKVDGLADYGNKYITKKQPWSKEISVKECQTILNNLSYLLQAVISLYYPIIPESSGKALSAIEKREKIILFNKIL